MANRTAMLPATTASTSLLRASGGHAIAAQEKHQLGSMTVSFKVLHLHKAFVKEEIEAFHFKMNVTTSGPHDGLFITTGIQANNSGTNGAGSIGNAWWRGMDQLALQQQGSFQPQAITGGSMTTLPIENSKLVEQEERRQSPFPANEEAARTDTKILDTSFSKQSILETDDFYSELSIWCSIPSMNTYLPRIHQPKLRGVLHGYHRDFPTSTNAEGHPILGHNSWHATYIITRTIQGSAREAS